MPVQVKSNDDINELLELVKLMKSSFEDSYNYFKEIGLGWSSEKWKCREGGYFAIVDETLAIRHLEQMGTPNKDWADETRKNALEKTCRVMKDYLDDSSVVTSWTSRSVDHAKYGGGIIITYKGKVYAIAFSGLPEAADHMLCYRHADYHKLLLPNEDYMSNIPFMVQNQHGMTNTACLDVPSNTAKLLFNDISTLDLSDKTTQFLKESGLNKVGHLVLSTEPKLIKFFSKEKAIRGRAELNKIKEALANIGLHLHMMLSNGQEKIYTLHDR